MISKLQQFSIGSKCKRVLSILGIILFITAFMPDISESRRSFGGRSFSRSSSRSYSRSTTSRSYSKPKTSYSSRSSSKRVIQRQELQHQVAAVTAAAAQREQLHHVPAQQHARNRPQPPAQKERIPRLPVITPLPELNNVKLLLRIENRFGNSKQKTEP